MKNDMQTLDQINPPWFRRGVMIIISPFMTILTICMMLFIYVIALGFAIADPVNAKTKVVPFISDIFLDCVGSIKFWHIDIWNGNTIRCGAQKNRKYYEQR